MEAVHAPYTECELQRQGMAFHGIRESSPVHVECHRAIDRRKPDPLQPHQTGVEIARVLPDERVVARPGIHQ